MCIVIKLLETLAPEETTTKMQCLTGEVAVRVKINVITIFIWPLSWLPHVFAQTGSTIGFYFPIFAISFVVFVCIYYIFIFECCAEMSVWLKQNNIETRTRVWCLKNVMHSWFCDVSYVYIFENTLSLGVSVLSDIWSFRNLTFYNVLAWQGFLFCNFPSFRIAWH